MAMNANATTLSTIIGYDGTPLTGYRKLYYLKFENGTYTNINQVAGSWRARVKMDLEANGWNIDANGEVSRNRK